MDERTTPPHASVASGAGAPEFQTAPPRFASTGSAVLLSADGTAAQLEEGVAGFQPATCDLAPMIAGVHSARFIIESKGLVGLFIGCAGGDFDALEQRSAWQTKDGWMLSIGSGFLAHNSGISEWVGKPADGEVGQGATIDLQLDIDRQTLDVSLNGKHRGAMVQRGMKDSSGAPVALLEPPIFWAVDLSQGSRVRIAKGHTARAVGPMMDIKPTPPLLGTSVGPPVDFNTSIGPPIVGSETDSVEGECTNECLGD